MKQKNGMCSDDALREFTAELRQIRRIMAFKVAAPYFEMLAPDPYSIPRQKEHTLWLKEQVRRIMEEAGIPASSSGSDQSRE